MLRKWTLCSFSILLIGAVLIVHADDDSGGGNPFAYSNNNNEEYENSYWNDLGEFIDNDDLEGLLHSRKESVSEETPEGLEPVYSQLVIDLAQLIEFYVDDMGPYYDPEILCRLDTFLETAYNEWLKVLFDLGLAFEGAGEGSLKTETFFFHAKKSIVKVSDLDLSSFFDSGPAFDDLLRVNIENAAFIVIGGEGVSEDYNNGLDQRPASGWWQWFRGMFI